MSTPAKKNTAPKKAVEKKVAPYTKHVAVKPEPKPAAKRTAPHQAAPAVKRIVLADAKKPTLEELCKDMVKVRDQHGYSKDLVAEQIEKTVKNGLVDTEMEGQALTARIAQLLNV